MKNTKRTLILLLIAISMVLVSIIGASSLQTNFGQVDVIDIRAELTDVEGQFSALMYKPKTATPDTPAPVVIASHGYLNNREMQDIALVELARRGIIVISMDRTGHGHSEVSRASAAGMISMVEYASKLSFVDASKIGITGHSMGGASTVQTLSYYAGLERTEMFKVANEAFTLGLIPDEIPSTTVTTVVYEQLSLLNNATINALLEDALATNKIHNSLTVAYNTPTNPNSIGIKTIVGNVAGQYDDFFYKQAGKYTHYNSSLTTPDLSPDAGNMTKYEWAPKDFKSSPTAALFIQTIYPDFQTVTRNLVPIVGQDGYDPDLLDETMSNPTIEIPLTPVVEGAFYTATGIKEFSYNNPIDERAVVLYTPSEIHPWNHFSTTTAGYTIDFFNAAYGLVDGYTYKAATNQTWLLKEIFNLIGLIGFFTAIIPLALLLIKIPFFAKAKKQPTEDLPALKKPINYVVFFGVGIAVSLATGFLIRYATSSNFLGSRLFPTDEYFPQGTTNYVSLWAALSGLVILSVFILQYFIYSRKNGNTVNHWGLKLEFNNVVRMFLLAISVIICAYMLLGIADFFAKTDFRIWSFAIRTMESIKLDTAIRYMPIFFVFYFANSIAINGGNRIKGMPEWLNIMICAIFNVFGIALVFAIQYITSFSTGILWQQDMNLTYIVLFPIIPILIIAAIFSRILYRASGSVWLPVFVNTMLFTLITVANTSTSYNYLLFR